MLYLYKNYLKNKIERAKRAEAEWFDEEDDLRRIQREVEISPGEGHERAPRKEDEGIPGEEKPVPGKPEITLDELIEKVETVKKEWKKTGFS